MKQYYVYDISLDFDECPNTDIYTAIYDDNMIVNVPNGVEDEEEWIAQYIIENIEVNFDTQDESYFELSDAIFLYKPLIDSLLDDVSNEGGGK